MRKIAVIVLALLILGCSEKGEDARDVLEKALKKYENASYEVTMVSEIAFDDHSTIDVKYGMYKGDMFLERDGIISASNGSILWTYNGRNLVINDISRMSIKPKHGFAFIYYDLLKNYKLELIKNEEAYVIDATPTKHKIVKSYKVWIDKEELYPIKTEAEVSFGLADVKITTDYRDIQFKNFSDEVFNIPPPKFVETIYYIFFESVEDAQKIVNFSIVVPGYTAGCTFKSINTVKKGSVKGVVLLYDDDCSFYLVEGLNLPTKGKDVTILNVSAKYNEGYNGKSLSFVHNNMTFEIISNCLTYEDLIEIAKSIISSKS